MYGCVFEVIVIESSVRPWKAPSNAITAGRFVYERANLIAFSTASVPALKNAAFAGPENGADRDQPLGELDVDLVRDDREVRVREARQLLLRGLDDLRVRVADVEAADAAREVDERVAVDVGERRAAPSAVTMGWTSESGAAITRSLRSTISRERGPGISVRSSIDFVMAMR